MDKEKALAKIKKCLALSKSSNEHEAAAALSQAQKLMAADNLEDADVLASEANEATARAGAKKTPAQWENNLAVLVARAFGCELMFQRYWEAAHWCYIGCGATPQIASYAFTVLYRQAKNARTEYTRHALKRCKPATRVRRADLFCDAWVDSVQSTIGDFTGTDPRHRAAINAYMALHFASTKDLKTRDRNDGGPKRDHEWRDLSAGQMAGRSAQLHRGVDGKDGGNLALTDVRGATC